MNLAVIGTVIAVMLVLLATRLLNLLAWAVVWFVGLYVIFNHGFTNPVPASVVTIYMGIAGLAMMAYILSTQERTDEVKEPLLNLIVNPKRMPLLVLIVIAIPAAAAVNVYRSMSAPLEAPVLQRTVHPAIPSSISVLDETYELNDIDNPYRTLEQSDPDGFAEHVENGRRVYYENCFYCHGDDMRGDGMYAHALVPVPANFEVETISILQESYLFWRITKGGPGLPAGAGPWDSAMPAFENFLTADEIWDVILFLYDFTELRPRAREEHHE